MIETDREDIDGERRRAATGGRTERFLTQDAADAAGGAAGRVPDTPPPHEQAAAEPQRHDGLGLAAPGERHLRGGPRHGRRQGSL